MSELTRSSSQKVEERIQRIVEVIKAEEQRLRTQHPILQYQNLLGMSILVLSFLGMLGLGLLYFYEVIPVWICVISTAVFASFTHELEHDLIHKQYFRKNPFMHNFMMLMVWMLRPNTVNPWYRRSIHLLHHKTSGTEQDLEERLLGNGMGNKFLRFFVMADGLLGILLRMGILKAEVKRFNLKEFLTAAFPFATFHFLIWHVFLAYHCTFFWLAVLDVSVVAPVWLEQVMVIINFMTVVLIGPNVLRSFCLNFITSYMHYYGGVTNILQQTQILKPWFLWPMQLFCFNFGSTHAIHHFVVDQPFYIRSMLVNVAHKVMTENGVRYNDLTTFFSANRYLSTH
ncbi:MAG: fatty acid desaturase [Endozoicomonadaceae bacterium]|nr:fatty acid desaturase [Endozoicomonadaceae bacterium]